jgi:hypothetical protein
MKLVDMELVGMELGDIELEDIEMGDMKLVDMELVNMELVYNLPKALQLMIAEPESFEVVETDTVRTLLVGIVPEPVVAGQLSIVPRDTGALGIEPTGDVQGYAGPELPNIGMEDD